MIGLMRQAMRFATVGVASTLLGGALIFWARMGLGLGLIPANLLGYGAGLVLTYLGSRYWVFRQAGDPSCAGGAWSLPTFAVMFVVAFLGNLAVTAGLLRLGLAYPPSQIAGMAVYSLTMFLGGRCLVFAPQDGRLPPERADP